MISAFRFSHLRFPLSGLLLSISLAGFQPAHAQTTASPSNTTVSVPASATPGAKFVEIHKPLIPASWGKVIQYKKEDNFVLTGQNRETLYEFVFQNAAGIIRTATYHETPDGDGYWEVYVWDNP